MDPHKVLVFQPIAALPNWAERTGIGFEAKDIGFVA
jgi:hypothetical protein